MNRKKLGFLLLVGLYPSLFISARSTEAMMGRHFYASEQKMMRKPMVFDRVKEKAKRMDLNAKLSGDISAIAASSLTVISNGKSYQVNFTSDTKLHRRFGAKSSLAEFSIGDKVNVVGNWTDDTKTAINATYIRDASIQKRNANFRGAVVSKGDNSFVLDPKSNAEKRKANKTVSFAADVVFKGKANNTLTFADIQVGDKVTVFGGTWNRQENKLFDVAKVIDSSR